MTQLCKSDPIFNMRVNAIKPDFNMEPTYRVTMLTRVEWTRGPRAPPTVKGLAWYTDESRTVEGTGAGVYGQSVNRRLSIPLGKHATVFQAEVYAILACVEEIETQDHPEKYASICSNSQAALKALQAAKTTSPLVRQCQKVLDMTSLPGMLWGYIGSLGMLECEGMKSPTNSQGVALLSSSLYLSLSWGVSRQNIRRKLKCWMGNQHLALWHGTCNTQRQAQELILGPDLATGARLLYLNRTQTKVVIGLLMGHNTLSRHLYIMGLGNDPTCRKCGTKEENSVHILCQCEAVASLRYIYLGSFFLDPDDIKKLGVGAIWLL